MWIDKPKIVNGKLYLSKIPGLGVRLPKDSEKKYSFVRGSGYSLKK